MMWTREELLADRNKWRDGHDYLVALRKEQAALERKRLEGIEAIRDWCNRVFFDHPSGVEVVSRRAILILVNKALASEEEAA